MQVVSPWEVAKRDEPPSEGPAQTEFSGRRWRLFWLALRTGLLTVLTLGIYRFWMKTRLRRWYWSSWRPGGNPLEYVGDPWEKLLGFLIAVAFLAFYIGIVNLLLMFASFSLFNGNVAAYFLSFLGVIPLWFYARYRARRYVLARTRWRGVRFGLEPGAWGFAGRALWHWFLTIISLGLLWPRKAFYLEKYITDRTYFGTQKLHQNGSWFKLLGPWVFVLLMFILPVAAAWIAAVETVEGLAFGELFAEVDGISPMDRYLFIWSIILILTPLGFAFALVNYNVKKLRYLTSQKSAGDVEFSIKPRFWAVTGIYFWGYTLAGVVVSVLITPAAIAAILIIESNGLADLGVERTTIETLPEPILTALAIALYFLIFVVWSTLMHAFIRYPLMRHYASTLTMSNSEQIDEISQRPRDEFSEAEGFAEALDVGAAI